MGAITIGPLMFAPERFAAVLAAAIFVIAAEVMALRLDPRYDALKAAQAGMGR
ncbi:hypothetical protein ACFQU1_10605 [Chelatococcus sp. GCM10030263]|uniref:hypothetical protein n=1 Tax=Chelatococcus sp. GCM10030263 TaxID=3273387 RepID=UPI0036193429